eukprot:SAG22_NODE_380_length_11402_cov_8.514154_15_plen_517_part_00
MMRHARAVWQARRPGAPRAHADAAGGPARATALQLRPPSLRGSPGPTLQPSRANLRPRPANLSTGARTMATGTTKGARSYAKKLLSASEDGTLDAKTIAAAVAAGVDLNKPDEQGWNPLLNASINGHINVVQLLLDHGAATDLQVEGRTARDHAYAESGRVWKNVYNEIVEALDTVGTRRASSARGHGWYDGGKPEWQAEEKTDDWQGRMKEEQEAEAERKANEEQHAAWRTDLQAEAQAKWEAEREAAEAQLDTRGKWEAKWEAELEAEREAAEAQQAVGITAAGESSVGDWWCDVCACDISQVAGGVRYECAANELNLFCACSDCYHSGQFEWPNPLYRNTGPLHITEIAGWSPDRHQQLQEGDGNDTQHPGFNSRRAGQQRDDPETAKGSFAFGLANTGAQLTRCETEGQKLVAALKRKGANADVDWGVDEAFGDLGTFGVEMAEWPSSWSRLSRTSGKSEQLFTDGGYANPADIRQGQLGTCYFLGALGALAHDRRGLVRCARARGWTGTWI